MKIIKSVFLLVFMFLGVGAWVFIGAAQADPIADEILSYQKNPPRLNAKVKSHFVSPEVNGDMVLYIRSDEDPMLIKADILMDVPEKVKQSGLSKIKATNYTKQARGASTPEQMLSCTEMPGMGEHCMNLPTNLANNDMQKNIVEAERLGPRTIAGKIGKCYRYQGTFQMSPAQMGQQKNRNESSWHETCLTDQGLPLYEKQTKTKTGGLIAEITTFSIEEGVVSKEDVKFPDTDAQAVNPFQMIQQQMQQNGDKPNSEQMQQMMQKMQELKEQYGK
ncbi:MAG: hypothetical protein HQL26_05650 [Candidatus Omnitrophica bacterium]|nr:hypothetical protein [Candidatus Omnitrophota bacterium]